MRVVNVQFFVLILLGLLVDDLLYRVIIPAYTYKENIVLEELAASYDFKSSTKNLFFGWAITSVCVIYGCMWIPIIIYIRKKASSVAYSIGRFMQLGKYLGLFRILF